MLNQNEEITNELIYTITKQFPEVNYIELQKQVAGIVSMYNVKVKEFNNFKPDLKEKFQLFFSAKKLEGISPLTVKSYKYILNAFSKNVNKPVNSITTQDVRSYLSELNNKPSSVATKIWCLKSFFDWLFIEEYIVRNPMSKIKTPKQEIRLPKALSEEEIEIEREGCQTLRQKGIFELLLSSGMRLDEIGKSNKNDIDWNDLNIKVIGKGNKERFVYFSLKSKRALLKYLDSRKDICPALFVTMKYPIHRLGRRAIEREVTNIGINSGADINLFPHKMRHTLATTMLNKGADISSIQKILGHSNIATTQIYAVMSNERAHDEYKRYSVV